jgi:hypothetical protein
MNLRPSTALAAVVAIGLTLAGCGASPSTPPPVNPSTADQPAVTPSSSTTTTGPGQAPATTAGALHSSGAVSLRVTTPQSGQTVALPAPITYAVTGIVIDQSTHFSLRVQMGDPVSYTLALPITQPDGTVELPLNKTLPGHRTLTITLVNGDSIPVGGPQASVTLQDVTITGPR